MRCTGSRFTQRLATRILPLFRVFVIDLWEKVIDLFALYGKPAKKWDAETTYSVSLIFFRIPVL